MTLLGLAEFRRYVESLDDPLPDNLLDQVYLVEVHGLDRDLPVKYKTLLKDAFGYIKESE